MLILGLNMFHADASAAIVLDGEVKFAIAEERLNRRKHFGGFPALAVRACLDAVGAKISDVEHVAVGQDTHANLAKKLEYALFNPTKILNFIHLRQRKVAMRDVRLLLSKALEVDSRVLRFREHHLEHHVAHIASAYFCSPWEKAAGFSYDGSGDFVSTMMARCEGGDVSVLDRVFLPRHFYERKTGLLCPTGRDFAHRLVRDFGQRGPEIGRRCVGIFVGRDVFANPATKNFFAQKALQHADDGLPLSVGDVVERLFRHIAARHRLHNGMGRAFRILPHCPLPIGLRLKPDHPFGMETVRGFVLHPGGEPHSATNCPTTAW